MNHTGSMLAALLISISVLLGKAEMTLLHNSSQFLTVHQLNIHPAAPFSELVKTVC